MRDDVVDCRELVGIAVSKRASGRNWRQVRDDLVFYLQGRGAAPRIRGEGADYRFDFPDGQAFYHRADGVYGCEHPEADGPAPEATPVKTARSRV